MIDPLVESAFIHAMEPRSRANGPGSRFVVWFQGCTLGCAGCFNPATHAGALSTSARSLTEICAEIDRAMAGSQAIDGLTLSGGEPMQQIDAAIMLLGYARQRGLSTLVFSGYTKNEIELLSQGDQALAFIDVLVDGRYRSDLRLGEGLRGSSNQQVHLLTNRYQQSDIEAGPLGEVRIGPDGVVVLTGVVPLRLKR